MKGYEKMPSKALSSIHSESLLAPYAMSSPLSKGRSHNEKEHPYRSMYQRDRERVLHTTAFRRLEYKTQVFVNYEGDYYRTRLTHTLEVAQIARTIARALSLNEDLVEAISLAHDLGHTPFGHSGEEILNELMQPFGGFDHNMQSLRVIDLLEKRYPEFAGLNLTFEVREGIARHSSSFDNPPKTEEFDLKQFPTLEAQIVDVADEIAYFSHDLDDGLTSRILSEPLLEKLEIWKGLSLDTKNLRQPMDTEQRRYQAIRALINRLVTDLIGESEKRIKKYNIDSVEKARKCDVKIIDFSSSLNSQKVVLRDFLLKNFYKHYRVMRMANKAKRFIVKLFNVYLDEPRLLPSSYYERAKDDSARRAIICDYIAGMTDRYALDEYKKLFEPYERV